MLKLSRRFATATCFAASLVAARADVTIADYNGTGDFSFNVDFMTDLDQKRSGLGLGGAAFSVPTACMNLLTYAANFGFPDVYPGPGLWEGTDGHAEMTGYIFSLANGMGTDWEDGTSVGDAHDELVDVVAGEGLNVVTFFAEGDFWPLVDDCAYTASNGAVLSFCYGRWETLTPELAPEIYVLDKRAGGHFVTLQRAVAENAEFEGPREIGFRDPSSSDSINSNSEFATKFTSSAANIGVAYDYDKDIQLEGILVTALQTPLPDDGMFRLLDSYISLSPAGALSFSHVEVNVQFAGGGLGFSHAPPAAPFAPPSGGVILDVTPHPELHSAMILLSDSDGRKSLIQAPHGQERAFHLLDLPANTQHLALGYGHTLIAVTDTDFIRLRVHSETAQRMGTMPIPRLRSGEPSQILDTASVKDFLFALEDAFEGHVFDSDTLESLSSFVIQHPFRGAKPRAFAVGRDSAAFHSSAQQLFIGNIFDGRRGRPWRMVIALDNGALLEALLPLHYFLPKAPTGLPHIIPARSLWLSGVSEPIDVDIDDGGRLYVSDAQKGLLEFTLNRRGQWSPARYSRYESADFIGRRFAVFKSRTNYRPEIHGAPGWRNFIHPDDLLPLGPEIED